MTLQDAQARQQALSPDASFIVQAPAGSGKTELLTQRFLKLLNHVERPEQVFALTFTRAAASEMRARVLSTLEACLTEAPPPHRVETFALAKEVLAKDKSLNWQLLQHPGRLRILTLDALCQFLTAAIPFQKEQAGQTEIDPFPERLYERAALACFQHALEEPELQAPLFALLTHLDNRQDLLLALWIGLLYARDQWLGLLLKAKQYSKSEMEVGLQQLKAQAIERLLNSVPRALQSKLFELCSSIAPFLPQAEVLRQWQRFHELSLEQAKTLASLLLTTQGTLRKKLDHHVGWTKTCCDPQLYQALKTESKSLFAALPEAFINALNLIQALPAAEYDAGQWSILQSLFTLLPLLVAHLKLVFQSTLKSDFTEVAAKALEALGDEDAPTDLALYLDYRIQHLLIDEFQDTSYTQFHLLCRLTAGWQRGDGRSLFIVGDPMQSIYRFRQAEVALFLKVQQEGIGQLQLTPLSLCCNFRSSPELIDFVNQHMAVVFPKEDQLASGAVKFHSAVAVRPFQAGSEVRALLLEDRLEEARQVLHLVQSHLAQHTDETLAILVRARTQLELIIPLLQKASIVFEGVDLFSLGSVAHLRDIYSLMRALLMPAERLFWFCVLRSPYVGLSLVDLHAIVVLTGSEPIYPQLRHLSSSEVISEDGRMRLQVAATVFERMFELRYQYTLSEWILHTHQQLHAEAWCGAAENQDLEQFFDLVDQLSVNHFIADWKTFDKNLQRLFVRQARPASVKIMTIHQAKGLEFHTVILPGLGAKTRKGEQPLLRLLTLAQPNDAELTLISPLKAADEESCPLYDYLGLLEAEKEAHEQLRVLYVALTRAKNRLYLLDACDAPVKGSFRAAMQALSFESIQQTPVLTPTSELAPQFYRVPLKAYLQPVMPLCVRGHEQVSLQPDSMASALGVIAHRFLQWLCENEIACVQDMPWRAIEKACLEAGFLADAKEDALKTLHSQFTSLFASTRGQWIIAKHEHAKNEYALLVASTTGPKRYVIDRTFVESGVRWIIDFKTGLDDEAAMLEHRAQVDRYAACFSGAVKCGLYYLAMDRWVEWEYIKEKPHAGSGAFTFTFT